MTVEFFLCEPYDRGNGVVAGPFGSPREAGVWRRKHPPVFDASGPYLRRYLDGVDVGLSIHDFPEFLNEFVIDELELETGPEATRFP